MGFDTIEINLVLALYYLGPYCVHCTPALCSWSLHEHAHEALMSICAHESFMSMLMKLSCARAREGVTRTTTIGQYATGNSTSTRNKGPSGLKFSMRPYLTKLTTTQHNSGLHIVQLWSCAWRLHAHVRVRASWACSWSFHEHKCSWELHEHAHEGFTSTMLECNGHNMGQDNKWPKLVNFNCIKTH